MANPGVPAQRLGEEVHIGQCQVPTMLHGTSIRLFTVLDFNSSVSHLQLQVNLKEVQIDGELTL